MTVQPAAPPARDEGVLRYKLTVDELYALVETGHIAPEARIELLDGELYIMTPPSSDHSGEVNYLTKEFYRLYSNDAIIRVQDPVYFTEHNFVEPDVTLLKIRDDFYKSAHPTPADVLLLVEVSKTTLGYDKGKKLNLYARLNIVEVWIVNLPENVVEVYRQPTGAGYTEKVLVKSGESVAAAAFPGREVVVLCAAPL